MGASIRAVFLVICLAVGLCGANAQAKSWTYVDHGKGDPSESSEIFAQPVDFASDSGIALRVTCQQNYEREGIRREKRMTVSLEFPRDKLWNEVAPDIFDFGIGQAKPRPKERVLIPEWEYYMSRLFGSPVEVGPTDSVWQLMLHSFPAERYSDARDRRALESLLRWPDTVVISSHTPRQKITFIFPTQGLQQAAAKLQQDCAR